MDYMREHTSESTTHSITGSEWDLKGEVVLQAEVDHQSTNNNKIANILDGRICETVNTFSYNNGSFNALQSW